MNIKQILFTFLALMAGLTSQAYADKDDLLSETYAPYNYNVEESKGKEALLVTVDYMLGDRLSASHGHYVKNTQVTQESYFGCGGFGGQVTKIGGEPPPFHRASIAIRPTLSENNQLFVDIAAEPEKMLVSWTCQDFQSKDRLLNLLNIHTNTFNMHTPAELGKTFVVDFENGKVIRITITKI